MVPEGRFYFTAWKNTKSSVLVLLQQDICEQTLDFARRTASALLRTKVGGGRVLWRLRLQLILINWDRFCTQRLKRSQLHSFFINLPLLKKKKKLIPMLWLLSVFCASSQANPAAQTHLRFRGNSPSPGHCTDEKIQFSREASTQFLKMHHQRKASKYLRG